MNVACSEYRNQLLLLALRRKLAEGDLSQEDRLDLEAEIVKLEKALQMD